jgi:hypothetical protein
MQEDKHKIGSDCTPYRGILLAAVPLVVAYFFELKRVIAAGLCILISMMNGQRNSGCEGLPPDASKLTIGHCWDGP